MEPRSFQLNNSIDIHSFFRGYRCHAPTGWWFRGQADAAWRLLPKAGRPEYSLADGRALGRFLSWSKQAIAYDPNIPDNPWERLAVAQHFGLATCLLDWTFNPLVATYFACADLPMIDGAVYCFDPDMYVNERVLDLEKIECNGVGFTPRAVSRRVVQQRATFTVHLPANVPLEVKPSEVIKDHPNLVKLTIPSGLKPELLRMLDDYGINAVNLFPDLEGLSKYINWQTQQIAR